MAQNITLMGASYSDVPAVELPKTGGGTASFTDVTDTTATAADVRAGVYFYDASGVRTLGTGSGLSYVTSGLIAYWDGINNTGSGHDANTTTWVDIVGGYNMSELGSGAVWGTDALRFDGTSNNVYQSNGIWSRPTKATIEVVLRPLSSITCVVASFDRGDYPSSGSYYNELRRFCLYSDNTIGFIGKTAYTYINPYNSLTNIRKMVCVYDGFDVSKAFINGTLLTTLGSRTHSFRTSLANVVYVGSYYYGANPTYTYDGDICAIRVYNRELTNGEMAQNLVYDNLRFNLGL